MTAKEVIEKMIMMYEIRQKWQSDIAEEFSANIDDVGYILRMRGYVRGRIVNTTSVDDIFKDPYSRLIAEKLATKWSCHDH